MICSRLSCPVRYATQQFLRVSMSERASCRWDVGMTAGPRHAESMSLFGLGGTQTAPARLGGNPYDKGEFVIFVAPCNLPASCGREIDTRHDELIVLCPTAHALSVALERSGLRDNSSAADCQVRSWFSVRIIPLSPKGQLLSEGRIVGCVVSQPPCSCHRESGPKPVGPEPKLIDGGLCRIREWRHEWLVCGFRDGAGIWDGGYSSLILARL
jgi:hypothetical protein